MELLQQALRSESKGLYLIGRSQRRQRLTIVGDLYAAGVSRLQHHILLCPKVLGAFCRHNAFHQHLAIGHDGDPGILMGTYFQRDRRLGGRLLFRFYIG